MVVWALKTETLLLAWKQCLCSDVQAQQQKKLSLEAFSDKCICELSPNSVSC